MAKQMEASAQALIADIRDALESTGIKFGDVVEPEHILTAALDYIKGINESVANSSRVLSTSKTYGPVRSEVIANSVRDYNRAGSAQRLCSRAAWVNNSLREAGFSTMTDEELRSVPR